MYRICFVEDIILPLKQLVDDWVCDLVVLRRVVVPDGRVVQVESEVGLMMGLISDHTRYDS